MTTPDRYTCAEMFRRLDDYLDKQLAEAELHLVQEHLENCVRCAAEYKFERQVVDRVREKLCRIDVPERLVERLSEHLRSSD